MSRIALCCAALLWAAGALAQDFDLYVSDAPNFGMPPWQILKYDQNGTPAPFDIS